MTRRALLPSLTMLLILSADAPSFASWMWVPLVSRADSADLVVEGAITDIAPGRPRDIATLTIKRVLKGPADLKEVKLLVTPAGGPVASGMIIYRKGQAGGWLLTRTAGGEAYTADYPSDHQPPARMARLESAVAAASRPIAALDGKDRLRRLYAVWMLVHYLQPTPHDPGAKHCLLPADFSRKVGDAAFAPLGATAEQNDVMLADELRRALGMPGFQAPPDVARGSQKAKQLSLRHVERWWKANRDAFRVKAAPRLCPAAVATFRVEVSASGLKGPVQAVLAGRDLGQVAGDAGPASTQVVAERQLLLVISGPVQTPRVEGLFLSLSQPSRITVRRPGDQPGAGVKADVKPLPSGAKPKAEAGNGDITD